MHERLLPNDYFESEMKPDFSVRRVTKGDEFGHEGLGFGEGTISGLYEQEILRRVDNAIETNPDILVKVEAPDDGCGDGRGVNSVWRGKERLNKSLNRAKVFGGSVVMTLASFIGFGAAKTESLNDAFDDVIEQMVDAGMEFGAHTDEHAAGDNCGCGAIDKANTIIWAAARYEKPIRGVIAMLMPDTTGIEEVYPNFRHYAGEVIPRQPKYIGSKVMERITGESKVVKELAGEHKEKRIILNMVKDYTVNQELIREVSNGEVQAFAVDVWRLEEIAHELYAGKPEQIRKAIFSMLIYTLATAAVLTKGDLPVYAIEPQTAPISVV